MSTDTPNESSVQVRVLGPLTVIGPSGPIDPGGHQLRLLLALLVARAGRVVTYDRLIDGLWGDEPPASAKKSLQVLVSHLRRNLHELAAVETVDGGYRIAARGIEVDAQRFERAVDTAAPLVESDPDAASRILTEALGWWAGPPYADLTAEVGIRAEATRLDELRLRALELRTDAELRLGHHAELIGELEALVLEHPFRERFQAQHMLALYRAGRQAEAVRAFDRTRRALVEELGLEPSAELVQLQQDILEQASHLDHPAGMVGNGPPSGRGVRGYELRERLGRGHHGTVYRAFQRSVGREVAIEVIAPEVADDPDFVRRFEAECLTIAQLEHPHILTLLDSWREPGGAYLVTPWMRGGSVAAGLDRGPWRPDAAVRLVAQVGSALTFAHRHGVVHGSLTAASVLLDADDNAYVAGWGRPATSTAVATAPTADVEALARLAVELLTGCRPPLDGPPAPTSVTRAGLPSVVDEVLARALGTDPTRRYATVPSFVSALRQAFGEEPEAHDATDDRALVRNPYKGLRAFGEADAPDFFGRDALLAQLVERVGTTTMTTVVGPSGCGKSSLVNAGLVPLVRRDGIAGTTGWVVARMTPGTYPFEELEACLLRVAVDRPVGLLGELAADERGLMRMSKQLLDPDTRLLLVVDQFEELFTQPVDARTRDLFIANLVTAADDERSRLRIALTLRADFFDRPLRHVELGRWVQAGLLTVTAPTQDELRDVITRPAARAGLRLEPGLVDEILHDVAHEPGALPLLEYALTELVGERTGHALTFQAYQRIGGVDGALAARAERIHAGLSPRAQHAAREILLRLVRVHDGGGDTRRRVRRTEIDDLHLDAGLAQEVLDAFGSYRLLTFDHDPVTRGPTVEVAHESLLHEWPRYRAWIDERREDLLFERRIADAVVEWSAGGRDPSLLFHGAHLEQCEDWAARRPTPLTIGEQTFLDESRSVEDAAARTITRRRRIVLGAISALAFVAVVLASIAMVQRDRADHQAAVAADEARRAGEAAAAAEAFRVDAERVADIGSALVQATASHGVSDPDLALLLAMDANELLAALSSENAGATSALYHAVLHHDVAAQVDGDALGVSSWGLDHVPHARWNADGSRFLLSDEHTKSRLTIVDVDTNEILGAIDEPSGDDIAVANWDHATDLIHVGSTTGHLSTFDPDGPTLVERRDLGGNWVWPFWTGDGLLLCLESAGRTLDPASVIAIEDDTGEVVFEDPDARSVLGVSPSGELLASWDRGEGLVVRRMGTWEQIDRITFESPVAWVAGEDQLWTIDEQEERLVRVDAVSGERSEPIPIEGVEGASQIAPSPDGSYLALRQYDRRRVVILDAATGERVAELPTDGSNRWVAWTPDGRRLITISLNAAVVWQVSGPSTPHAVWPPTAWLPSTAESLTDDLFLLGSTDGDVVAVDAAGAERWARVDSGDGEDPPIVSADGSIVVSPGREAVAVRDASTGAVRTEGPAGYPRPLAVSTDGTSILVATARDTVDRDSVIALVDGRTGEIAHLVGAFLHGGRAMFTADDARVVIPIEGSLAGGPDRPSSAVWVVDVETGAVLARGPDENCLTSVAISSDDRFIAAGACDGHVSLYDLEALLGDRSWTARLAQDSGGESAVQGTAFGPGLLVATHTDGRVDAWSVDATMAPRFSFDVGVPIGAPSIRDGVLWFGTMELEFTGRAGEVGGMIGVPLDHDQLLAVARSKLSRTFTEAECVEHLGHPCADR